MFKRINIILNYTITSFIGVFIGHCVYKYINYIKYPSLYEVQSAPWYISIQINGIAVTVIVVISIIIKIFIKKKM